MSQATLARPYIRHADLQSSHWYLGSLFSMLATEDDTHGAFGLMEIVARKGGEPPLHTHTREDEAFFVLDGRLTFRSADQTMVAESGSFVFLPRGLPHGFSFETDSVHMLALVTPGGVDKYFIETGIPAPAFSLPAISTEPVDVALMVEQLNKYGVDVVGPPLRQLLDAEAAHQDHHR